MEQVVARKGISGGKDAVFDAQVIEATPHRLVSMMFEGVETRISQAKDAMERKEIALKGEMISQSITIVDALRESLNLDDGGNLAENLWLLYEYVAKRLVIANSKNSIEMLNECNGLLEQVKNAWNEIPMELHAANRQELRSYAVAQ